MEGNKVISSAMPVSRNFSFARGAQRQDRPLPKTVKIIANHSLLGFNSGCDMANLIENSLNRTASALVIKMPQLRYDQ